MLATSLAEIRRNYFSDNFFMRSSNYELAIERVGMTWVDLMNSFGNALGRSLGFSIITVVELICFLMAKPIVMAGDVRHNRRRDKSDKIPPYRA